jgi:hypothetical protein
MTKVEGMTKSECRADSTQWFRHLAFGLNSSFVIRASSFPILPLAIGRHLSHNRAEMSGIFFDIPSVRFLRRFRFLEPMRQIFAASLLRWLSAPACASSEVHFRHTEAEFPSASQSACEKFDWTLDDSRAADGVPSLFGALRSFNNWTKPKNQHELLFIRKTLTPLARWGPTQQRKSRTLWRPAGSGKDAKKDILETGCRIFRERRGEKENRSAAAQRHTAFATGAQA